jgi:hypothetical protein
MIDWQIETCQTLDVQLWTVVASPNGRYIYEKIY